MLQTRPRKRFFKLSNISIWSPSNEYIPATQYPWNLTTSSRISRSLLPICEYVLRFHLYFSYNLDVMETVTVTSWESIQSSFDLFSTGGSVLSSPSIANCRAYFGFCHGITSLSPASNSVIGSIIGRANPCSLAIVMIKSVKTAPFYSFQPDSNSGVTPLVRNYRFSLDGKQGFSLVKKNKNCVSIEFV